MGARSGQAHRALDGAVVTGKNLAMGQQVKKMKQLMQFFFLLFLHQMHHFCTNHPHIFELLILKDEF